MTPESPSPQLADALESLAELPTAAHEFGIPAPSGKLVSEARRILHDLYQKKPRDYAPYLMPDGTIAIDIRGKQPDGILITLKPDGSAHCSGEIDRNNWRKPYPTSKTLPDKTLLQELDKLDRVTA